MSEYLFGQRTGRLTAAQVKLRERIATAHGCTFVYADMPGDGLKSWFAGPNRGQPFDAALSRAVAADIEAAEYCPYGRSHAAGPCSACTDS